MTVAIDTSFRGWSSHPAPPAPTLEDKFEIIKDIGDGSFGSVVLARTRSAGAHLIRRNTLVAIKTMKKTFESFAQCLELREVIFLKTLPSHPHLVPAYDIFLDPLSKKLHIAMENMDGNLYQLMKTRDHKPFDGATVKSILFQILSGLEHIHENGFFHRDIKPENILVSSSAPDSTSAFKRYSALVTPPSTPPTYTIKLADFGLARETHSMVPYTTYVSTRWYRAPEVLLRAGHYSAPVDIWALGAMAVEIATLKPLFPGGNEVDQVWRVCEIMGSPGVWINKHGQKLGGGEWKDGVRLAGKLGFSFPKMAPHAMDSIIQSPQWPASLAHFVTWCLLWDPAARPTSTQALQHEYFADAVDPLRPKSSSTRFLSRKSSTLSSVHDSPESTRSLSTKKSLWFRKSLSTSDFVAPPAQSQTSQPSNVRPPFVHSTTVDGNGSIKIRPAATKRASWNNAPIPGVAPIPILPSIKPVSPMHDAVNAQASGEKPKRQSSVNLHGNHYSEDYHREQAERALSGMHGVSGTSSANSHAKESFFSHLRKRARRFSGRNQVPASPSGDELETSVGCGPWATGRQSMSIDGQAAVPGVPSGDSTISELDKALQSVRNSLDASYAPRQVQRTSSNPMLKRHHSLHIGTEGRTSPSPSGPTSVPAPARTRKSVRQVSHPRPRYDTPDEEDELLDEALTNAHKAATRLDKTQSKVSRPTHIDLGDSKANSRPSMAHVTSDPGPTSNPTFQVPYLTPSPSKEMSGMNFGQESLSSSKPVDITPRQPMHDTPTQWPTPPQEEGVWAKKAAADLAAQAESAFR
ncbi:kinase-like domain-containing protein [Delphinella strobiligena]|nr:kinase-like domain-containing protein [Delphinella strobiligena]